MPPQGGGTETDMRTYILQLEHNDLDTKQERIKTVRGELAKLSGPELVLLPELWGTGFFSCGCYTKNSEDIYGETLAALSDAAREKNTYIFTGSFIEKCGGRLYNTSLLLDRRGNISAMYRKIHLFGDEKKLLSPGGDVTAAETELGVVGLSICYDLRFPELYRALSSKGAELLLSCYALPAKRLAHWQILTPARALENQAFFLSCGCAGTNNGVLLAGHSMAVSPSGEIICEGRADGAVLSADIDINLARRYRHDFSALRDRKIF